ncbi:hypothetical protein QYF52_25640 [Paenibacillus polymyxa]|uniref:hypothetical protein n=1 Tax=Paenibacillus polymyxa TaxID=1406 RepID=UPI0025B66745|nr:hypothetical protein [Paenibacillus polymyxa]MDN4081312.1 hypothetical protein [Paenibacillus polymyxa]MDN4116954.1 hypothetical protein [Paenibacillus polymyxa]
MKKTALILLIIMVINIPGLAAAAAPPKGNIKVPDGGFEVTVPKGSSGTFAAKTSGGSSKFVPSEGGGKYYLASIRFRVKGKLSAKVYATVTFGDGYQMKITDSIDGRPIDIGPTAFRAHKSKAISLSIHSDGSAEKFIKLAEYGFLPEAEQGGTTSPPKRAVGGKQRLHRQKVAMVTQGAVVPVLETPIHRVMAVTIPVARIMEEPPIQETTAVVTMAAAHSSVTHART